VAHVAEPVIRRIGDVPQHEWNSSTRGSVRWWELIGGDTMPTSELVVGIAEVSVGAGKPPRGHTHAPAEVYYIISGNGEVCSSTERRIHSHLVTQCGYRRTPNMSHTTWAMNRCD